MTIVTETDVPAEMAASVQHLEGLERAIKGLEDKLDRLKEARKDTLKQIACEVKRQRDKDPADWESPRLLKIYEALRAPFLGEAWKSAGLPHLQAMKRDVDRARRYAPNDPDSDGWVGQWEVRQESWGPVGNVIGNRPGPGISVVYVLYSADYSPAYCGSTKDFEKRLLAHFKNGKEFVAWRAVPCEDRERAYELEDRLLKEHCPPLNKKASR
ncbi:GIY-YIG nuclease family protein [Actinoplanes sp. NPDC051861]|uniref:GIY-YIG nuclease family protein n=1 Tax=Actinoplanes sp. NPDC051861 TaxID=3155170 RepID=UPI0034440CD8